MTGTGPVVELRAVTKSYGRTEVLHGVDLSVRPGAVTCVLGDNGAGESTLIKILAGAHRPTSGELVVDAEPAAFSSPQDALAAGIATVYQDLALVDLMPVWRNFFLGTELTGGAPDAAGPGGAREGRVRRRRRPFRALRRAELRDVAQRELARLGVELDDVDRPVGTLSGGQRQSVAIARAEYLGARVLVLDEPTAALGVRQSGTVLRLVAAARDRGVAVVLVTHNPAHALAVGDHFTVLSGGAVLRSAARGEVTHDELVTLMAGGTELAELAAELGR